MKQKIRFLLAMLLAIAFTQGAWAQTFVFQGYTYSVTNGEAKLESLPSGTTEAVVLDVAINAGLTTTTYPVTQVSSTLGCYETLQSITLPATLKQFDGFPSNYSALKVINMSRCTLLTSIGEYACDQLKSLETVALPSTVTRIEEHGFANCPSLKTINLDKVTSFGEQSFSGCKSLVSLSLTGATLGEYAFSSCTGLTTLTLNNCKWAKTTSGATTGHQFYQCQSLKDLTLTGMESISSGCFDSCYGLETVVLDSPCSSLGEEAFCYCTGLKSVTICGTINTISNRAFYNCNSLNSVTLNSGVNTIGSQAFQLCSSLEQITLPQTLSYIEGYAFSGCNKLKQIALPQSLLFIGNSAFMDILDDIYCMGKSVIVTDPNFYRSTSSSGELKSATVHVPVGYAEKYKLLKAWNKSCFNFVESGEMTLNVNAGLSNGAVQVWAGGSQIGTISSNGGTFSKTMELPSSVQLRIPDGYLDKILLNGEDVTSSLAKTALSDGYTGYTIEKFSEVTNVYVISNYEHSLKTIPFADSQAETVCLSTTWDKDGDGRLSVEEAAAVTIIGRMFNGKGFTSFDEFRYFTGVTSVGDQAFVNCKSLTSITLPPSVESIGDRAFYSCEALTSVRLPDNLKSIGNNAFSFCNALQKIFIPAKVETVGVSLFSGVNVDRQLSAIVVDAANTKLDSRGGCNAIIETETNKLLAGCKNTIIPEGIQGIGQGAFWGTNGLTSVVLPSTLESIDANAFYGCQYLTSVVAKMAEPFTFGSSAFNSISSDCVLTVPTGTRDAYIAAGWTEDVFKGGVVEETKANGGDINGDGKVTIADVTKLVNMILGKE